MWYSKIQSVPEPRVSPDNLKSVMYSDAEQHSLVWHSKERESSVNKNDKDHAVCLRRWDDNNLMKSTHIMLSELVT